MSWQPAGPHAAAAWQTPRRGSNVYTLDGTDDFWEDDLWEDVVSEPEYFSACNSVVGVGSNSGSAAEDMPAVTAYPNMTLAGSSSNSSSCSWPGTSQEQQPVHADSRQQGGTASSGSSHSSSFAPAVGTQVALGSGCGGRDASSSSGTCAPSAGGCGDCGGGAPASFPSSIAATAATAAVTPMALGKGRGKGDASRTSSSSSGRGKGDAFRTSSSGRGKGDAFRTSSSSGRGKGDASRTSSSSSGRGKGGASRSSASGAGEPRIATGGASAQHAAQAPSGSSCGGGCGGAPGSGAGGASAQSAAPSFPSPTGNTIPSVGAALHMSGNCHPCKFHTSRRGCYDGSLCRKCHLPHEELSATAIRNFSRRVAIARAADQAAAQQTG